MKCRGCGVEAAALKTVRCRDDAERIGVLCNDCYIPLAGRLWIVPGGYVVWGRCLRCLEWVSLRELRDAKPGGAGRGDAPAGTCVGCAGCQERDLA